MKDSHILSCLLSMYRHTVRFCPLLRETSSCWGACSTSDWSWLRGVQRQLCGFPCSFKPLRYFKPVPRSSADEKKGFVS